MGKIYWLASYPKSGNTWLRTFLENYTAPEGQVVDINSMKIAIASQRDVIDDLLGVESSNLTDLETENYRPKSYSLLAQQMPGELFLKVHEAFEDTPQGVPIFPPAASHGVIYILRNPLDVAVSYAAYIDEPVDETIRSMAAENRMLAYRSWRLYTQVKQRIHSWSQHVLSWVDQKLIPCHCVRYEDMLVEPRDVFSGVLRFANLPFDDTRLQLAIEAASFSRLQKQEQESGFRERPPTQPAFFRQGRAGAWRAVLSEAQRDRIISDHREVMQRFGYLTRKGEVVY
jgi:hypothetical protein